MEFSGIKDKEKRRKERLQGKGKARGGSEETYAKRL